MSYRATRRTGCALLALAALLATWVAVHGSGGLTTLAAVALAVAGAALLTDNPARPRGTR